MELRSALLRVKGRPAPSNASGFEVVLGQGSEVPSAGTSLFARRGRVVEQVAQIGVIARAEQVTPESAVRIRLSRAPHMKRKYLLGNGAGVFTPCRERNGHAWRRSIWEEVVCSCDSVGGLVAASGIMRTLSRMVEDAVLAETPFTRVFDARHGAICLCRRPLQRLWFERRSRPPQLLNSSGRLGRMAWFPLSPGRAVARGHRVNRVSWVSPVAVPAAALM